MPSCFQVALKNSNASVHNPFIHVTLLLRSTAISGEVSVNFIRRKELVVFGMKGILL